MITKKILIITDAWVPQINGVVRTLQETAHILSNQGHEVCIFGPDITLWNTFSLPSYPSIKLEFFGHRRLQRALELFNPDFIHIATEGPLGWAARQLCLQLEKPFTTAYHTRFPEYLAARMPAFLARPLQKLAYAWLRRFHAPSSALMVATPSLQEELRRRKFHRVVLWSRGVDTNLFRPYGKKLATYASLPRPILLYVGRVSVEKNLRTFLNIRTKGSHVVIGDGPDLRILKKHYRKAHFLGSMHGKFLAEHYAAADLFVFPSTTDTFGLVLLEACACGLRIASYPSTSSLDIFTPLEKAPFVALDRNLKKAVQQALLKKDAPDLPHQFVQKYSWISCTQQFFKNQQASTPQAVKRLTRLRQLFRH